VHVVGHDWGSIQTWESVTSPHLRERILSFTTLSGPCLDHAGHWMRKHLLSFAPWPPLRQLAKSWYITAFQLPLLAPVAWHALGARWPRILKRSEGLDVAPSATQTRDGIHGIELYRANVLPRLLDPRERTTDKPVQLIVALQDDYMRPEIFDDIARWAPATWRRDVDAGHWGVVHDGERLASWVRDFITQVETGQPAEGLRKLA
jgi:pimeloyl-ACP methyl ester carboxylesterase